MNRNRAIYIGLILSLVFLLLIWLWPKPKQSVQSDVTHTSTQSANSSSPVVTTQPNQTIPLATSNTPEQDQLDKRKKVIAQIEAMLNTSITFYGKVVDQEGKLIPNVRVGYALIDKFNASGTTGLKLADETGYFEINKIKGAEIGVNVSKAGYYQIPEVSYQSFAYGMRPDATTKSPPTKDNPAIFVLQKMEEIVSLFQFEKDIQIARDGKPTQINLETGNTIGKGDFQVETWTEDQNASLGQHYNWKCRVSVPGGGLVERKGEFDFEAPMEGYRATDEILMSKNAERWSPQEQRNYFLKLGDGRFARISFTMRAGGEHFFTLISYLNPKVGSRNLEYDPAKVIKP